MPTERPARCAISIALAFTLLVAAGCAKGYDTVHQESTAPPEVPEGLTGVDRLTTLFDALPGSADPVSLETLASQGYSIVDGVVHGQPSIVEERDGELLIPEEDRVPGGPDHEVVINFYLQFSVRAEGGEDLDGRVDLGFVVDTEDLLTSFPRDGERIAVLVSPEGTPTESFMGENIIFDDHGQARIVGGAIAEAVTPGQTFDEALASVRAALGQQ